MEMVSSKQYREMNKDKDLKELLQLKQQLEIKISELEKSKDTPFISDTRLSMCEQYLEQINNLIKEKENDVNGVSTREPFKLSQLKYTKHHWMSGEIVNGCPITTSIEIKPEMLSNNWKVTILHTYMMENNYEEKIIKKEYNLPSQDVILEILERNDLRDLKNNYFSDDKIQRFSHWELEYNNYFKISGTFDQEPEEIKKVISTLNCENIINETLEKVEMLIKNSQNIDTDKVKEIVSQTIDNNDLSIADTLVEIVKKIIEMSYENETTIAKLIDYNPDKNMIDPLIQGFIMNYVEQVCEKLGIKIQLTHDSFDGLAFNYSFKKIN